MKKLMPFVSGDKDKCTHCKTCEVACHLAHHGAGFTAGQLDAPVISKLFVPRSPDFVLPAQCHQCENAPCITSCPQKAVYMEENRVSINTAQCNSCNDCVIACPFGAVVLIPEVDCGEVPKKFQEQRLYGNKCDLCNGRLGGPACVEACPEKVLRLVEVGAENQEKKQRAARCFANMPRKERNTNKHRKLI
jgi:electron transport protein HydN